jgi:outer membrane lipoprotein LolB
MTKGIMKHFSSWLALAVLVSAFMFGCSTMTQTQPAPMHTWPERQTLLNGLHAWQIKGKIGIQTTQDSGSANVEWLQNNQQYSLTLSGPLGATQMTLTGSPAGVMLKTAEGKEFHANNPEQLLREQWHWQLPVSYFPYWVKGVPSPASPYQATFDDRHRITLLRQNGWTINYLAYQNTGSLDLPEKLSITSSTVKAKIVIHEWIMS